MSSGPVSYAAAKPPAGNKVYDIVKQGEVMLNLIAMVGTLTINNCSVGPEMSTLLF